MPRTTLAERQERLAQQRARLALEENRLREAERRARTRRLIEAGGLVERAGLLNLEPNALYGALLGLAGAAADPERLTGWRIVGGQAFDREARARAAGREPLVLTAAQALPTAAAARLRGMGFRWSRVLKHWEGLAPYDEARALADELGADLRRVAPAPPDAESHDATGEPA